jgi:sigma-E factor negative regulatory protein RseA
MMEDSLKEKLCLLLDGELDPNESLQLLRRIEDDPLVRAQWTRYSLTSEVMRSGRVLLPDSGFVDRTSTALAEEPTILAPRPNKKHPFREKIVTTALAASLALLAVLVGKSLKDYSPIRGSELLARAELMGPSVQSPIDPEFRDFLAMHHETAYLSGAQGMLPSVRLVSTDPTR